MIPLSILIPLALCPVIFLYLLWTYSFWYRRGVPQGNPFKLFGDMNDFTLSTENYVTIFNSVYNKDKDCPFRGIYQLFKPSLLVRDTELIKDVMSRKFQTFPDTASQITEDVDFVMARDPFFRTGQEWKDSRADFTTLMTPARIRMMFPQVLEGVEPMCEFIRNCKHESGGTEGIDAKDLSTRFITESLVSVLFGGKAGSFTEAKNIFKQVGEEVFLDTIERKISMVCVIGALQLNKLLKLRLIPKKTTDLLLQVIQGEIQRRENNGIIRNDLFDDMLKKAESIQDKEEANKFFVATIIGFYVEGFESTSVTAAFTLYHLAKNPDIQEALRREICDILPKGKPLNDEVLTEVLLLENCILESMRITPPITMLQRRSKEDTNLEAPTGEKVFLKKDSIVNIPILGVHHDERVFPDPETYDPNRFNDKAQKRMFLGFGDGPRQCIGRKFALRSISIMIASILQEFNIELSPKLKLPLTFSSHPFFLYPADTLWLRFVPLQ